MPIKEVVTTQIVIKALESETLVSGNVTSSGAIIDTAGYDNGVFFTMDADGVASGSVLTMKLSHGDNSLLSDVALVPAENLIYGTLPVITASVAEGAAVPKEGVFGTKRYVQAAVVKSGGTVDTARVSIKAVVNPEIAKTPQAAL